MHQWLCYFGGSGSLQHIPKRLDSGHSYSDCLEAQTCLEEKGEFDDYVFSWIYRTRL